jgi:hypothetical protein
MVDVAEAELLSDRAISVNSELPTGEDAPISLSEAVTMPLELDSWLTRLSNYAESSSNQAASAEVAATPIQLALLPATFAIASYRASLLPLLGDVSESTLQGGTGTLARLPITFATDDALVKLDDPHVAAISAASLSLKSDNTSETKHE